MLSKKVNQRLEEIARLTVNICSVIAIALLVSWNVTIVMERANFTWPMNAIFMIGSLFFSYWLIFKSFQFNFLDWVDSFRKFCLEEIIRSTPRKRVPLKGSAELVIIAFILGIVITILILLVLKTKVI